MRLVLVLLATFWAWETLRYILERYAGPVFSATRPLHPFVVAALPLYILWPDWVAALAVAGAAGLLVAVVDRALVGEPAQQLQIPRRRGLRGDGLPPMPR
jgi:hypothetical protein